MTQGTEQEIARQERVKLLISKLEKEILVLDGATGTALQEENLTAEDFGGEELEGCNENLVLTRPDVIASVHNKYLDAGADIIETNTFGGTPVVLAEYDLQDKYYEINLKAAQIARECADNYTKKNPNKPRFVAASVGPTTKAITVTGGITFEELIDNFYKQGEALLEGGVDYFLVETCQDTRNIKAALIALNKLMEDKGEVIPVAVSGTIEPMGTMLAGQSVESLVASLEHVHLLYLGLNCATGPEFMTDHIRSLSEMADTRIACVPNAGLPDEDGLYLETPAMMSKVLDRFISEGWVNLIGGCCGTTAAHIKAFSELSKDKKPRTYGPQDHSWLSGVDFLDVTDDKRPLLVGERTNVIGSKKFRDLICDEKFDEAAEIAKAQVKKGAHIIDVCLANPDRDENEDMVKFLDKVIQKIRVPLMIDSTDEDVIELSLTYSQGKAIINSINLEDGEERFEKVCPLATKYGAALVVGTIDDDPEQGMAVSRERKLEVATRSYDLLTKKYGVKESDIYWDPLVFPCATGDENYVGSAVETIEGIRLIKEKYPLSKSVLGISNVSFGLPPAGREVLNSVFLYHCVQAGLDMAIVNTEKVKRFTTIPEEEVKLAEDLLWNRGDDPIAAFAAFYRGKKVQKVEVKSNLTIPERLAQYILEGTKDGLIPDLEELRATQEPMDIINGPLMAGMAEVGRLFNDNKLIVAEVLQSAEVMKTAVSHLEQFMEKEDAANRGKIILATVKGDVHDIGKNLVDIVLSNNGYEVVNLGIKVTSDQLISAIKEHKPDMVGLSGLLVKSAQQMAISADDLAQAGIDVPIMVGGAALSKNFVNKRISKAYTSGTVMYARDAMDGLELANAIIDPEKFDALKARLIEEREALAQEKEKATKKIAETNIRSTAISDVSPPEAPDFERHVIKNTPIDMIWSYINPLMLYGRHLGIKGKLVRHIGNKEFEELAKLEGGEKAIEIYKEVEKVKAKYRDTHLIPSAVYQFYKTQAEGNHIHVLNEKGEKINSYRFPRQKKDNGLCLSDYVSEDANKNDNMAMFVVTVGKQIREESQKLKEEGNYLHSHILAALALESAEAYAELLHGKIRALWGYPDDVNMTMMERFQAKYHGKRYSFGYPACPKLDDQDILFDLLQPTKDLGVELTEGHMMDPESSVSAIVFHHPQATYFSVGERGLS